jgi:CO/xanthine dehydrogenase Mo-binding subunit
MSSSACLTAFHQVHVAQQAARVLLEASILPAAAAIWGVSVAQIAGKTAWTNGQLTASGFQALSLPTLAARAYAMQLPKGAMVHGLYQGSWVSASYAINGSLTQLPIDGLALQSASSENWQVIVRQNTVPPDPKAALYGRSLFAPSGVLIAVEVNPKTGKPKVTQVELLVDAGKVLQPDLLMGQAQGGIAMGIGYALLEDLPLEQGGAGDGTWNLDRYHVALASDMPRIMNITPLPSTEPTAKGIAEAVLCPIAPAIGNAIAHATGKRLRSLPITAAQILGAKK